jgi:hypothetical protein
LKKFGSPDSSYDFQTTQIINNEVLNFIRTEKLNKEAIKILESRIEEKLTKLPG